MQEFVVVFNFCESKLHGFKQDLDMFNRSSHKKDTWDPAEITKNHRKGTFLVAGGPEGYV